MDNRMAKVCHENISRKMVDFRRFLVNEPPDPESVSLKNCYLYGSMRHRQKPAVGRLGRSFIPLPKKSCFEETKVQTRSAKAMA